MTCNFSQFESLSVGDQTGVAYSRTLRTIDLYVMIIVSLSCPQEVPARDLRTFSLVLHLEIVLETCLVKVFMELKVTPRTLGVGSILMTLSLILIIGEALVSLVSGVKSVTVDFSGDISNSLSSKNSVTIFIYSVILSPSEFILGP